MTTLDKNKAIAKFMGWLFPGDEGYKPWLHQKDLLYWPQDLMGASLNMERWSEPIAYDKKFGDIMPVAKKCLDMVAEGREEIYAALHECEVKAIFEAVYNFIVWLDTDEGKEKLEYWKKQGYGIWKNTTGTKDIH